MVPPTPIKLHLSRFVNKGRPSESLDHIQETSEIPADILDTDLAAELEVSISADPNDDYRCAAVGRLWESMLDRYPDTPFLILRVADMRLALGQKVTALTLYEKLQNKVNDPAFSAWLETFRTATYSELRERLRQYLRDSTRFTPSQRWKSGTCNSPFPYCKLQRSHIASLRSSWDGLCSGDREGVMARYINYHSIETNALEGVVSFDNDTVARLVREGFQSEVPVYEGNITDGAVRDVPEALSILQDTSEALKTIIGLIEETNFQLSVDTICRLHKILMKTSRILRIRGRGEDRLSYVNIGVTRQHTYANVFASSIPRQGEKPIVVQFCPYHEVDAELTTFCARFNELMRATVPDMDPFAAAAWTSHVFVTIHPFEDGNGRSSRIIASIPLLKHGLPPLCVPADDKSTYISGLNVLRANSDGDYSRHMEDLYSMTTTSLSTVAKILGRTPIV